LDGFLSWETQCTVYCNHDVRKSKVDAPSGIVHNSL
jgi:hypothetical protein